MADEKTKTEELVHTRVLKAKPAVKSKPKPSKYVTPAEACELINHHAGGWPLYNRSALRRDSGKRGMPQRLRIEGRPGPSYLRDDCIAYGVGLSPNG